MKNGLKVFGFIALVAVIFFSAACSSGTDISDKPDDGKPDGGAEVSTGTYKATKSSVAYTFNVSSKPDKAVHAVGDAYTLIVNKGGTEKTSSGKVADVSGSNISVQPKYKDAPLFTVTVSGTSITKINGTITFDDGSTEQGLTFTSGGGGGGGGGGGSGGTNTGGTTNTGGATAVKYYMDISKNAEWDYLAFAQDGSSMVFNVDKSTGKPTLLYLKPEKNSDAGYTFLFKGNGMPDIMIYNDHIFYFDNFSGYNYEMAVITPNGRSVQGRSVKQEGTTSFFLGGHWVTLTTDMFVEELTAYKANNQGKYWTLDDLTGSLDIFGTVLGLATCAATPFVPGAIPGCFITILSTVTSKAVEIAFEGTTNDVFQIVINALNCATADVAGCASTVAGIADLASTLSKRDLANLKAKMPQIEAAMVAIAEKNYKPKVDVTGVALNKGAITLAKGDYARLNATTSPPNATMQVKYWNSSNPGVATVNHDGYVSAKSPGTATITVETYDGKKTASCTVTVTPAVITSVSLNKSELFLIAGDEEELHATVVPSYAASDTVWVSSNPSVAAVSNGLVTALKVGTATITATNGNKTAACEVNVSYSVGIEMVRVEGGSFQMGKELGTSTFGNVGWDDFPVYGVTLSSFYIGKYEVTQEQWYKVMGSLTPESGSGEGDNYPIQHVNLLDALMFCNMLSVKEGLSPAYSIEGITETALWGPVPTSQPSLWSVGANKWCKYAIVPGSNGYRLPTEAQWEYAAKGGNTPGNFTYAGSNNADEVAWHYGNSGGKVHEVGKKLPNSLGLYDMSGNVAELCWGYYGYPYVKDQIDPDPMLLFRTTSFVYRGGSWSSDPTSYYLGKIRLVDPNGYGASGNMWVRANVIGFRVVRPAE